MCDTGVSNVFMVAKLRKEFERNKRKNKKVALWDCESGPLELRKWSFWIVKVPLLVWFLSVFVYLCRR